MAKFEQYLTEIRKSSAMDPDRKTARADIRKVVAPLAKAYAAELVKKGISAQANNNELTIFSTDTKVKMGPDGPSPVAPSKCKSLSVPFAEDLVNKLADKYNKTAEKMRIEAYEKKSYPATFFRKGFQLDSGLFIVVEAAIGGPYAQVWVRTYKKPTPIK